jgi:phosphate transport system permease protein
VRGGTARRRVADAIFGAACTAGFVIALAPLLALLVHAAPRALGLLLTASASVAAGDLAIVCHAAVGSAAVVGLAALIGIPVGILAGAFLAESPRGGRVARLFVDLLAGVPAVVLGLVVHVAMVLPMRRYSLLAGAVALALVVVPPVARGTDALLSLVPGGVREAALSLGLSRWRVVLVALLPAVRRGVAATSALAVSRALGETAPVLLTVFHARGFLEGILHPVPTLPVGIWLDAAGADPATGARAWTSALLLLALAVALRTAASLLRPGRERARR